jgi:hypothetical protein
MRARPIQLTLPLHLFSFCGRRAQSRTSYWVGNLEVRAAVVLSACFLQTGDEENILDVATRIIGDYPRGSPISHLHDSLNIESLRDFIHHLTAKLFY